MNVILEHGIRRRILQDAEAVRHLLVSPSAAEMLRYIARRHGGEVRTADIAREYSISTPNASSKLAKLSRRGYLARFEKSSASGGREYSYSVEPKLLGYILQLEQTT